MVAEQKHKKLSKTKTLMFILMISLYEILLGINSVNEKIVGKDAGGTCLN
jgi:hypothetical protein